jgi:FAD/FMN-containing dehydrogenase
VTPSAAVAAAAAAAPAPPPSTDHDALAARLAEVVGPRYVLRRPAELRVYDADGLPGYHRRPALAVLPGTRDEVVAVVRLLAAAGVPFVARGAGTGLSGGALADGAAHGAVLLGLNRLTRVLRVDPDDRVAVVEPGVVNARLGRVLAPHGLHYAPDPSSQSACTVGGNVAENAGGPHCLKYGVTLNHVVAATVVLPDGEVVALGNADGEAAGYDLLGAFVGSEGCFGVALDVTVRLTPDPEAVRTLLASFATDRGRGARHVGGDRQRHRAGGARGDGPPGDPRRRGERLRGRLPHRLRRRAALRGGRPRGRTRRRRRPCGGALPRQRRARGARRRRRGRTAAALAGTEEGVRCDGPARPVAVLQDAVVPRTKLPEVLARIAAVGAEYGVRVANFFHAGDGNLHPTVPYDASDPDEAARVHAAMGEIMRACIDAGGTITGEHGVGLDKLPYMDRLFDAPTLAAMCRLREVFDPERRANPGKVVPVHACREWRAAPNASAGGCPTACRPPPGRRRRDRAARARGAGRPSRGARPGTPPTWPRRCARPPRAACGSASSARAPGSTPATRSPPTRCSRSAA